MNGKDVGVFAQSDGLYKRRSGLLPTMTVLYCVIASGLTTHSISYNLK